MKRITGLAFISFVFSIAGIVISALLLKEDVISTAHTIFEYFPQRYGVTPSSTWEGAIILGVFTSVLQVIAANVAFSKNFSNASRAVALFSFVASCVFDNWTDVVFRSGQLSGDVRIAIVTTLAFYTLGSEVTQGLSWLVFASLWRLAISDFMWAASKTSAGFGSISSEWRSIQRATQRKPNESLPGDKSIFNPWKPNNQSQNHQDNERSSGAKGAQDRFKQNQSKEPTYHPAFERKPENNQNKREN